MPKPSITKRTVKGAALTYSELDTNFQNLADATVTITGGSTAVTADLNGNITLAAGSNVTITGNNTTKTITISSTASGGSGTVSNGTSGNFAYYPSTGTTVDDTEALKLVGSNVTLGSGIDFDLNGRVLKSTNTNIRMGDDALFQDGEGPVVAGAGTLLCRGGNIQLQYTGDPGLVLQGAIVNQTPSNTSTPAAWLKITVNGSTRYIPLYT